MSWVVPLGHWSDHPGYDPAKKPGAHDGGPSFLAHIVNEVGESQCPGDGVKWTNTVILAVWDDWGGFYDHVNPSATAGGPGIGYPQDGGGSQYVYGFRVPLLVASAYAKPHYVSGPIASPQCVSPHSSSYCHDFGSILNFIEYVFGNGDPLNEINSDYHYADHWAPDAPPSCPTCTYSLADFFGDFNQPQPFTHIDGAKYPRECFRNPKTDGCFGANFVEDDPDDDGLDTE